MWTSARNADGWEAAHHIGNLYDRVVYAVGAISSNIRSVCAAKGIIYNDEQSVHHSAGGISGSVGCPGTKGGDPRDPGSAGCLEEHRTVGENRMVGGTSAAGGTDGLSDVPSVSGRR